MITPKPLNHWLVYTIPIALGTSNLISSIFGHSPTLGWPGWLILCLGMVLGHRAAASKLYWLFPSMMIGIGISEPIQLLFREPNRIGWTAWVFLAIGTVLGYYAHKHQKCLKVQPA